MRDARISHCKYNTNYIWQFNKGENYKLNKQDIDTCFNTATSIGNDCARSFNLITAHYNFYT